MFTAERLAVTVAVTDVLLAVVQPLAVASTQYCVVELIPGVVQLVPVPCDEPPDEASHQLIVPADVVAPNATVPVPHLEAGVVPVIVGNAFTVTAFVCAALFPQALLAVTEIFTVPAVPNVTVQIVVACAVIVADAGTLHVYDVAPETADIE